MKIYFKAYSRVLSALVTGAVCSIALLPGTVYSALADNDVSGIKIAAGFPIGPAQRPTMPGPTVAPSGSSNGVTSTPTAAPPASSEPANSGPASTDNAPAIQGASGALAPNKTPLSPISALDNSGNGKKMAQGTIEYDVSLAPISSQPGLSVVQAMNDALMNSPRAAAIRAQFGIARTGYAYATQGPNPVVFFDRAPVSEQVTRIGPNLTIEPPWKLAFRLLSTKRLIDQTKLDLMATLWNLRADVRRSYVEVIVGQETLKTLTELYDLSSKLLAVAEKRFHAGDVPELDMLKARLANSQNEVELGVGQKRVLRSHQQLNVITGKTVDELMSVPALPGFTGKSAAFSLGGQKSDILPDFDRTVPPLQYFMDLAFDNRLELKSLNQQIKVNQANLKGAYGNIMPNPSLAFGKSTENNPSFGPKLSAWFMTLNAEAPLSNWNQGDIFRYKATGRQLHYQIGAERNQIMGEVASAYQNLIAQREKIRLYHEHVLSDSYEVARLARRSYEVGQSDITSTLQAQQNNVQIRSQYLDAVTSYAGAFTDLEQACGTALQ